MMKDQEDEERSTAKLETQIATPMSYRQQINNNPNNNHLDAGSVGAATYDGTFVYEDDYSEMNIPPTPHLQMSGRYSPREEECDSVQDRASVGSSFMNYTYSNDNDNDHDIEDDSTVMTGPRNVNSTFGSNSAVRPNGRGASSSLSPYAAIGSSISASGVNSTQADIQLPETDRSRLSVSAIMRSADGIILPLHKNDGNRGSYSNNNSRRSCIPHWISNASNTLKFVIVLAAAMLLASLALVSITATVSHTQNKNNTNSVNGNSNSNSIMDRTSSPSEAVVFVPVPLPVPVPTTSAPVPAPVSASVPSPVASPTETIITDTSTPSTFPSVVATTFKPSTIPSSSPTIQPTLQPTISPATSPTTSPTKTPSIQPTYHPSTFPTISPTITASFQPSTTASPSIQPTTLPSTLPSTNPTPQSNIASFFAVAKNRNVPDLQQKVSLLSQDHGEWMIHLGNWNSIDPSKCREGAYHRTAEQYASSTVPVLFLPGKHEWNSCPDVTASAKLWRETFADYDSRWNNKPFEVRRQRGRKENFAFVHKKAVYIGLNLVSHKKITNQNNERDDPRKWSHRLNDNIEWVTQNVQQSMTDDSKLDAELVVMFGNAGLVQENLPFFDAIKVKIEEWTVDNPHVHFMYVKQGPSKMKFSNSIMELSNFFMLSVQNNRWPPTKISVDTGRYTMEFDDTEWYQEEEEENGTGGGAEEADS